MRQRIDPKARQKIFHERAVRKIETLRVRPHDEGGGAQVVLHCCGELRRIAAIEQRLCSPQQPRVETIGAPGLNPVVPHGGGERTHQQGFVFGREMVLAVVTRDPLGHGDVVHLCGGDGGAVLGLAQQRLDLLTHHRQQHRAAGEFFEVVCGADDVQQLLRICFGEAFAEVGLDVFVAPRQEREGEVIIPCCCAALAGVEEGVLLLDAAEIVRAAANHQAGRWRRYCRHQCRLARRALCLHRRFEHAQQLPEDVVQYL